MTHEQYTNLPPREKLEATRKLLSGELKLEEDVVEDFLSGFKN